MPLIDDGLKGKKLFKPKKYRPWNLLDETTESESDSLSSPIENKNINLISESDIDSKINLGQTEDKVETKLRTNLGQNNSSSSFYSISGLQKKITTLIYENCKASRDKMTIPMSIEHIAISCYTSKLSVRKTIQRLVQKRIILRVEFKNGRSGWTRYGIDNDIFQEILHNETEDKLRTKLGQTEDKVRTELRTELRTIPSSSSSNYNITTTSEKDFLEKWSLDIEPLLKIGFTKTHLEQIYSQKKLEPEIVQDSIYAFAFDLEENNKAGSIKGAPLNFFMGILRNGKPYAPPVNYESPSDKAMRVYLERKEMLKKQRAEIEEKSCLLAFEEWFVVLPVEEKKKYSIHGVDFNPDSKSVKSIAFSKFKKEIWENMKNKIINSKG